MGEKISNFKANPVLKKAFKLRGLLLICVLGLFSVDTFAGGALSQAATEVKSYIQGITLLMKAIAAVVGIVGGIRIFNKWQNGDQDVNKELVGWVGALIFILLVPTFVETILG